MASFNKIIMVGNLTRDPELSYLPSQTAVVEFGLASTRRYRGSDGQQKEEVCFVDCRMYGARAEVISKYLKKGDPLLIDGRLQFDRWEAQDGSKRSKHRIFVENFEFMSGRSGGGNAQGGNAQSGGGYNAPSQNADSSFGPPDDDIPF